MRKNQTLLVAGILLLATAVAVQAAQIYDVRGIRAIGREGGAAEPAGDVVLFSLSTGPGRGRDDHSAVLCPARERYNPDGDARR